MTAPPKVKPLMELCSDCLPSDYPTEKTRCRSCPRRHRDPADVFCQTCGGYGDLPHDHRPDGSGIDDGPALPGENRSAAKPPEIVCDIRSRAWATRRAKYGERGHR